MCPPRCLRGLTRSSSEPPRPHHACRTPGSSMRRRDVLSLLGGAACSWRVGVRAQQSAMPVIGFLATRAPGDDPHLLTAFRLGLKEVGYIEGQNVTIEYRFAENQYDRLLALEADLVRREVAVIAANGPAAQAAKAATVTIPIVFTAGFDPVEVGLVASLNQPGGNITGVSILDVELGPKRLEPAARAGPDRKSYCRAGQSDRCVSCRGHIERSGGGCPYPRAPTACSAREHRPRFRYRLCALARAESGRARDRR